MSDLVILVPVLARPHRVRPLLEVIRESTMVSHRVLFLADPGDIAEQDAIAAESGWMLSPGGNYAAKIRAGIEATTEPFVFLGADDLTFLPGWFEAARAAMVGGVEVVGINDLIDRPHRPNHATHFLMTRRAALLPCIDGSPGPMYEGMMQFVDDELIATAMKRGIYAYAPNARIRHEHPTAGRAPDDATYRLGRARYRYDRKVFGRRSRLWA